MKKNTIITLVVVIAVIGLAWYILNNRGGNVDSELAKCIGANSVLYSKTGCFACVKQKELFGDSYKFLNVKNFDTWEPLTELGITSTPTWVINDEKYSGVQSIETLKQLTGCE